MPRPSKGAHLYLRKRKGRSAVWVIRDGVDEVGTGCSESEHREAEKRLASYLAEKHQPDWRDGDPRRVRIADVIELYSTKRAPTLGRPEFAAQALLRIEEWWGDKVVADVTPGRCQEYAAWRTAQPIANFTKNKAAAKNVSSSTARRELAILSAALGYAFRERKLAALIPVVLPKKSPARLRWLSRSEAARLIWATRKEKARHVARFVLIALYTGSRHDAIMRLRWLPSSDAGWADLEEGLIFRKGFVETESSKRRPPVPISDRLLAHMRRWRKEGGAYVITWDGLPMVKMRRAWNTARKHAGLGPEVTPHVLRHTFASWALQEGHSYEQIAAAIGTTAKLVEDCYGHLSPGPLRRVVASVSGRGRR